LQQDRFKQLVQVFAGLGRNLNLQHIAAQTFNKHLMLQQGCAHFLRISGRFVDLVDGNNNRHIGSLGVVDGFNGLQHHAVIGGNNQHGNICRLGAAGAHGRESGMARRIDKGDPVAILFHLIGADMLGDTARFPRYHIGLADSIEQRCLAMVDMAHNGHYRRARLHFICVIRHIEDAKLHIGFSNPFGCVAKFLGNQLGHITVDHIAGFHHLSLSHQEFDHVNRALCHALCQFLYGDCFGDDDLTRDFLTRFLHLCAFELLLAAAHRCHGTAAEITAVIIQSR